MTTLSTSNSGLTITPDNSGELIIGTGNTAISAANTGNVRIHNTVSGNVFLENFIQQPVPVFKAYRAGDYNISNSTWTKVSLNVVQYDNYGGFSTSTYEYTAPISGYYHFNYGVQFRGTDISEMTSRLVTPEASSTIYQRLLTSFNNNYVTTSSHLGWSGLSSICFVEAGQTVYIQGYGAAASGFGIAAFDSPSTSKITYLAGYLVSKV